jgi:uncharacterized protein YkwD
MFALLLGWPIAAMADQELLDQINRTRTIACNTSKDAAGALRLNPSLKLAAQRLDSETDLRAVLFAANYRATYSQVIELRGWLTDNAIALHLQKNHCKILGNPLFSEIGIYQKWNRVRIILASPFSMPAKIDLLELNQQVLLLTNRARAQARRCGATVRPAAKPLRLALPLRQVALAHARDMARNDYFEHQALDGSQIGDRVTRGGYRWRVAGENLAVGVVTPAQAIAGWLNSPPHCNALMDGRFTEMGVAYAVNPTTARMIYWVQVFAAP